MQQYTINKCGREGCAWRGSFSATPEAQGLGTSKAPAAVLKHLRVTSTTRPACLRWAELYNRRDQWATSYQYKATGESKEKVVFSTHICTLPLRQAFCDLMLPP